MFSLIGSGDGIIVVDVLIVNAVVGNKGGDGRVELKKRKEGFLSGPSGRIVFKCPGRAGRAQANEDGGQVLSRLARLRVHRDPLSCVLS